MIEVKIFWGNVDEQKIRKNKISLLALLKTF